MKTTSQADSGPRRGKGAGKAAGRNAEKTARHRSAERPGKAAEPRAQKSVPRPAAGRRVTTSSQQTSHRHAAKGLANGPQTPMRIAKVMARAGLCSRRDGESWIADKRVTVNGKTIDSPALNVGPRDRILVDGRPLPRAEPPRLWRYHKTKGLVTSHKDPQGRDTVFEALPPELPRVVSVGRLDFNTEGLLLLTNDGALARHLELPATGWMRRYKVRVHGRVGQRQLDELKDGIEIDGIRYGPIEATLESMQGANAWLSIGIREGKNREVRRVLKTLGLEVNRLIRTSYGPFQLLDLKPGRVEIVRRRVLIDQLGARQARELGLSEGPDDAPAQRVQPGKPEPAAAKKPRRPDKKDRPKRLELVDKPLGGKPGRAKRKGAAGKQPKGKWQPPKTFRKSSRKAAAKTNPGASPKSRDR